MLDGLIDPLHSQIQCCRYYLKVIALGCVECLGSKSSSSTRRSVLDVLQKNRIGNIGLAFSGCLLLRFSVSGNFLLSFTVAQTAMIRIHISLWMQIDREKTH